MFRKYHYLNTEINKTSKSYCMTINNKLAGFMAIITFPHPKKPYKKVHRLVILPDYQGIGLSKIFLNNVANHTKKYPFAITTSNPALINMLKKEKDWICIRNTRNSRNIKNEGNRKSLNKTSSNKRIVTTFVKGK